MQVDLSFFQDKFPFFLDTEVAQTMPVKLGHFWQTGFDELLFTMRTKKVRVL
jgi:hypothetical protein